jgi:hypothetical protein
MQGADALLAGTPVRLQIEHGSIFSAERSAGRAVARDTADPIRKETA